MAPQPKMIRNGIHMLWMLLLLWRSALLLYVEVRNKRYIQALPTAVLALLAYVLL